MTQCPYPVETLLPHARPMILLDSVDRFGDGLIEASVHVSAGTPFFIAGRGIRAHVAVEWMAQACGAYVGALARDKDLPVKIGLLLGTRNFSASVTWFADKSLLRIRARTVYGDKEIGVFDCSVYEADESAQPLATAQLTVFQPDDITTFNFA